ncbi:hypothetical protein GCM10010495_82060 [Kitasatospora herbaricolor]|nr:hypothetical protein GCM10010495_82060 [Kitasatospora herbaricolor]
MFVILFMICLGIIKFWGGWSIMGEIVNNVGIWSYEGVVVVYIVLLGLLFLVVIWYWVYWDLELFCDECIGKFLLDLFKIFGIYLFLFGVFCFVFGVFYVIGLFGFGIWVFDFYGLIGKV